MGKKKKGGEAAAKPLDPALVEAVQCIKSDSTTWEAKVQALLALGGSSCGNDCVRMDLVREGILEPLLHLLRTGLPKEKEMTAYALRHLSGGNFLQTAYDNPSAIVSVGGANLLIDLVASGETAGQKEHAAAALCNLATKTDNRTALVQAGAVEPLLCLVRDGTEMQAVHATFALGSIAFSHPANRKLIRASLGLEAVEGLVRRFSDSTKVQQVAEYAQLNINEPVPKPAVVDPAPDPAPPTLNS
jgi:hypothetical protein